MYLPEQRILLKVLDSIVVEDMYSVKLRKSVLYSVRKVNVVENQLSKHVSYHLLINKIVCIDDSNGEEMNPFRNITMRLRHDSLNRLFWWEIKEDCRDETTKVLSKLPYASCDNLIIYTFNDKAFPATLTLISGKG